MRAVTMSAVLAFGLFAGMAIGGAADTPKQKVSGIGGVFFRAKDPKTTAAWYAANLGVPVMTEEGRTTEATFKWQEIEPPHKQTRTVWAAFPRNTNYFGDAEFMINYQVPDLDAMLVQLRAAGVKVLGEPENYPYGKFAWILDVDGRKVELWQAPAE